jgi:hypothetical protein
MTTPHLGYVLEDNGKRITFTPDQLRAILTEHLSRHPTTGYTTATPARARWEHCVIVQADVDRRPPAAQTS